MAQGILSLLLHAHLPYVRHPEYEYFLEEDWLYEAITETYIPLLRVFERLHADAVPYRVCMTLTPPLCHMLRDPLLQERYVRHLDNLIALAHKEVARTQHDPQVHPIATLYLDRFLECRHWFELWNRDLIARFAALQDAGRLEIITCAATHGFLPLMQNRPEALRAQIVIACESYRECFGRDPLGIWLPECAYVRGIEDVLQEVNIRWFVLDSHGLMFANPRPRYAIYAPVFTPAGPAAFARDRDSSRKVWSAEEGYPGDPAYRDFYRDIGYDLSSEYLRPHLPPDGARKFTGIKYHRITGRGAEKQWYNPGQAHAAVDAHAEDFMRTRIKQFEELSQAMDRAPFVLSPFDAELFGHWWFEGPEFLDLFIRKSVYDQQAYRLGTPSDYLTEHPTQQLAAPSPSSWGNMGYWEVWLDASNSWIYQHLHAAARHMTQAARAFSDAPTPVQDRTLRQLARELLLAQSSDWAFLMKTGTASDYAAKRTRDHLLRFNRLHEQLLANTVDTDFLENCEWRDNIFPQLDWRVYL